MKSTIIDSITDSVYMSLSKLRAIVKEREICVLQLVHAVAKSWTGLSD